MAKAGIHPAYSAAQVTCACGAAFTMASTRGTFVGRHLLDLPPVLHGQAEVRRHRRPHRALPEEVRPGRRLPRRRPKRPPSLAVRCHARQARRRRGALSGARTACSPIRTCSAKRAAVPEARQGARRPRRAGRDVPRLQRRSSPSSRPTGRSSRRRIPRCGRWRARRRPSLGAEQARLEEQLKLLLLPQGSERRQEHPPRDPRRHRRRGGGAVRRRSVPHVHALRRAPPLEASRSCRSSTRPAGGIKEVVAARRRRQGATPQLKYESGVHRVQRVPATEAQGRIHTSTATVAVMPEVEDVDVKIEPKDLKIEVMRSGGPGGQSVNTTDSAVRIHHMPIGPHRPLPAGEVAAQEQGDGDEDPARQALRDRAREAGRPPSARRAAARSAPATARRRSAPTTSRRIA